MPSERHFARSTRALALPAIALVLTSCGGGGNGEASGPNKLSDLFDPAAQTARQVDVQAAIQECMKAQGFDYTPIDVSAGGMVTVNNGPFGASDLTDEERKTNGYGITTGMGGLRNPESSVSDPNGDYMESLSEADREAYAKALHGSSVEGGEDGSSAIRIEVGDVDVDGEDSLSEADGCFAEAERSVPRAGPDMSELGPALREMEDRIQADPDLVKANGEWARCMQESGFDEFEAPQDIFEYLFGQMSELAGVEGGPMNEDGNAVSIRVDGAGLDEEALSQLQATEIAIAVADGECADRTGQAEVAQRVRAEQETRLFDEHPELGS